MEISNLIEFTIIDSEEDSGQVIKNLKSWG